MSTIKIFKAGLFLLLTPLCLQAASDLSGTWKQTLTNRSGETQEITLKFKKAAEKVTGTIALPQGEELDIKEGKIDSQGNLSFIVRAERDGELVDYPTTAKLDGDSLKGKTVFTSRDGQKTDREWIAKREKSKDLTGNWNSSFTRQDGGKLESNLRLKQEGNKLMGSLSFNDNPTEIEAGEIRGGEVSFKVVRDRDGRTVTSKYLGKIQPDGTIKGTIESDWTGQVRKLEWEARKVQ